jgi:hypothetical protein
MWYIDIRAVWEQKIHALAAPQSQTPGHWTERIRRHTASYSTRCNRQYVEGWRCLPLAFVNNFPACEYLPWAHGGCRRRKRSHEETRP